MASLMVRPRLSAMFPKAFKMADGHRNWYISIVSGAGIMGGIVYPAGDDVKTESRTISVKRPQLHTARPLVRKLPVFRVVSQVEQHAVASKRDGHAPRRPATGEGIEN